MTYELFDRQEDTSLRFNGSATVPSRAIRLIGAILCLPPALLGILFGLHILPPTIMATWCTSRRGCGGEKLWQLYPHEFPAIALGLGIAFACVAVMLSWPGSNDSSRLGNLRSRFVGLGALFGFAIPMYWIAALQFTNGSLSPVAFYAPLIGLMVIVGPIEVARLRAGKRFDEG